MNSKITYVIIDTDQYVLAKTALDISVSKFPVGRVLVFSDNVEKWSGYPVILINKIETPEEYNKIVIEELPKYLETDFCIVMQYDGFILNEKEFSNYFYYYDYIGAIWPGNNPYNVGNGGFSWRSKRLVDAVANVAHLRTHGQYEDMFIGRKIRGYIEHEYQLRFASSGIAQHFSMELVKSPFPTFGFHGIEYLPYIYQNNIDFFLNNISNRFVRDKLPSIKHVFEQIGGGVLESYLRKVESR